MRNCTSENLEIPRCAIAHLRSGPSDHPGMTRPRLFRLQLQRRRVDAIAQAGGAGAVLEHVAEMAIALRAQHFGADHAVADVALLVDLALGGRLGKAWPAAA